MEKKKARILAELHERQSRKLRLDPEVALFGPQRAFVLDESRLVVACCSRRAGKSYGLAFKFAQAALANPGCILPYITLTREDAKNIIHPAFRELDTQFGIGIRFRENNGDVVFPNGSKVILRGAGTNRETEKLRGPKYPMAAVDEAQGFSASLYRLVDEILEPATLDYNGQILVTGTPNAACAGPFHEIVQERSLGWKAHKWTLLENPYIPHAKKWLEELRSRRGWDVTHPSYLREYCGVWIRDAEGLVYEFRAAINARATFDTAEATDWEYVLGIDLGFNDPTAFVVVAYSHDLEKAIVVESYKESELIPSAVAAHVEGLTRKYKFVKIVADTGGFGKGYVEEMKRKFGIPVVAAKKTDKHAYVALMNGDFRTGILGIQESNNKDLISELQLLQWDVESLTRGVMKIDGARFEDHLSDALLYAWRECLHHGAEWQENPPKVGTREHWEREEKEIWESELRKRKNPTEKEPFWNSQTSESGLLPGEEPPNNLFRQT